MRVLQVSSDYYDTSVYENLFASMQKQIKIDTIVPLTIDTEVFDKNIINSKDVVTIIHGKSRAFGVQINSGKYAKIIKERGISNNVDLIHAHYVLNDGSIALKLYKKLGIPYVVSVRATCILNFDRKIALHNYLTSLNVLLNAQTIYFQSPNAVEYLLHKIPKIFRGKIRKKHQIISNGIDDFWHKHKFISRNYFDKREFTVFTAASIEYNKNLVAVAKAIFNLNKIGYRINYVVAGGIKDQPVYEELKEFENFRYAGVLNRHELLEEYRKSDVFVMLSHRETFGLVYAEAMSQGLPIIYSKNQGFDGQFEEGLIGFHASPISVEDIERCILKVADDYSKLSKNAITKVSKFKWDFVALKYISTYSEVLNSLKYRK